VSKNKSNKPKQKIEKKPSYKNPIDTIWGKTLVWILIIAMLGAIVIGAIYALLSLF